MCSFDSRSRYCVRYRSVSSERVRRGALHLAMDVVHLLSALCPVPLRCGARGVVEDPSSLARLQMRVLVSGVVSMLVS